MRHFLQYWKVGQADLNQGQLLDQAASAQFERVSKGDTLWIVTIRDGRLRLLGRLIVEKIVSQQEAEQQLGTKVYEAPLHAMAQPGTIEHVCETDIQDLAVRLRFESVRDKLKLKDAQSTDGRQLQSLRQLATESVELLTERWAKLSAVGTGPTCWWVSQNRTWQQESSGGYLWAPLSDKRGLAPHHWASMREVRPGDLVFHYVHGIILAVSQARSVAYRSPKPTEFAKSGDAWTAGGLKVDCSYAVLEKGINVRNHLEQIRPLLPKKYSPLTKGGMGAESYLVRVPDSLGQLLLELAGNPVLGEDGGAATPQAQLAGRVHGGAGFGSPEENKEVEEAAIAHVTREYEQKGWKVKSVEQEKCGFDLRCAKSGLEEHVEVKGVRGPEPTFTITAGEVLCAARDSQQVLCVVTSALATPHMHRFTGREFLECYELNPLSFRAVPRKLTGKSEGGQIK